MRNICLCGDPKCEGKDVFPEIERRAPGFKGIPADTADEVFKVIFGMGVQITFLYAIQDGKPPDCKFLAEVMAANEEMANAMLQIGRISEIFKAVQGKMN